MRSQSKEYKLAKRIVDSMDSEEWYDLAINYLFEQFDDYPMIYEEKLKQLGITEEDL